MGLGTVAMRSFNRTAFLAARAVSTGSNFGEAWRYDKGAFKTWATKASTEDGVEKKQLYAHLALSSVMWTMQRRMDQPGGVRPSPRKGGGFASPIWPCTQLAGGVRW